jgi:hypothetical protein
MRTDEVDVAAIRYFANMPANTFGFPVLFEGQSAWEVSAGLMWHSMDLQNTLKEEYLNIHSLICKVSLSGFAVQVVWGVPHCSSVTVYILQPRWNTNPSTQLHILEHPDLSVIY